MDTFAPQRWLDSRERVQPRSTVRRPRALGHSENAPGFRIVTIDCVERTFDISERTDGFCQSLAWNDEKFLPLVWHAPHR